jgi:UDP-2,4-diacetamido-2,4,6-trideoxy-beta-L-altropyranose hydrolase
MTKPKIWFRADGNHRMGLGHLIRSLALAQMLKSDFDVQFVCMEISDRIIADFKSADIHVIKINQEESFFNTVNAEDVAVLDGYQFDVEYQRQLKSRGCVLVCIDDMNDREYLADLIINPAPAIQRSKYNVPPGTRFALGPDYALLRSVFTEKSRNGMKKHQLNTVFICFGGSDAQNLTTQTYIEVKNSAIFSKIILVTGSSFEHREELLSEIQSDKKVSYHHAISAEQMAELMEVSDVAIVPSSGILIEVLALGIPAISGYYAENQLHNYTEYLKEKAFIDAGKFEASHIKSALTELKNRFDQGNLNGLEKRIIDGQSPVRFLKLFKDLTESRDSSVKGYSTK